MHTLTSAYRPHSNGIIERFNHLFDSILAKYVGDNTINKWDEYVDHALLACRIRQYYATGKTPFYMIYGVEVKLPGDEQAPTRVQQINQLVKQRDIVHQQLDSNAIKMKIYYDHRLKDHVDELQPNDWVFNT
ncbi:unnamed protein product [Rotaria sordida]|uniref:Integrase catalytic domain-containing protein n=1 Tax=Rotaria sordida TaxID=392033 RepID=A0A820B4C3_9BILA|nr:unnamed protein product [Rotaria sordida]